MRLLIIHSDLIEYETTRKVSVSVRDEPGSDKIDDVLVVFASIEKGDTEDKVRRAVREVVELAGTVHADKVLVYPFAHLSENLASPPVALNLLHKLRDWLSEELKTFYSPFGWYKKFTLKCKGHPLAEVSKKL